MSNSQSRRWTRQELIVAFSFYCRTPFGKLDKSNPEIIKLSAALDRTPSALAMKLVNFASLDPSHKARGVKGLSNTSKADKGIWSEFHSNWTSLAMESQTALDDLEGSNNEASNDIRAGKIAGETEVPGKARIRLVQSFFRATVLASYNNTCAVCQLEIPELLVASHVIPWAVCAERRADPTNGLSLCALHDKAFDRGFITIDDDFSVRVSPRVPHNTKSDIQRLALVDVAGAVIQLPERFLPDRAALEYHRTNVFLSS